MKYCKYIMWPPGRVSTVVVVVTVANVDQNKQTNFRKCTLSHPTTAAFVRIIQQKRVFVSSEIFQSANSTTAAFICSLLLIAVCVRIALDFNRQATSQSESHSSNLKERHIKRRGRRSVPQLANG